MLPFALLERLADGREHSRSSLCASLALDAVEFDRQLNALESTGLAIVETSDAGLRLAEAIDWIDVDAIEAKLNPVSRRSIESLERSVEVESTNRYLLAEQPPAAGKTRVAIAEYQTAGRGRHGRRWSMPPGTGIALSAAWTFDQPPKTPGALSLAVGVAARRAILDVTGLAIGLKWPNDLIVNHSKLGGILVEVASLPGGALQVVAGIGINVKVPQALLATVSDFSHGATDLSTAAPEWAIDRASLAARLIDQFIKLFDDFSESGFEPYRAEWLAAHVLDGQAVELRSVSGIDYATVRGIEADGSLIVEDSGGLRRSILSGDVTIRMPDDARH